MEQIKIDFERSTIYGTFRDALYLPADHAYTDVEIEAMQEERVQNWLAIIQIASEAPAELEPAANG